VLELVVEAHPVHLLEGLVVSGAHSDNASASTADEIVARF